MTACALAVAVEASILSTLVFGRIPHVQDSIAQLFQARIFAGGRLWAPSSALREFFDYAHMINDGRWYAQYPPGHALLLVPGVWLGIPWLVNPLLAGLGVAATYLLARAAFDRATARVSALLALVSPFLLFMAAEYMSHVSGFVMLTAFVAGLFLAARESRWRYRAIAAAALAFAVLIRPYTAFAMALPAFAWILLPALRQTDRGRHLFDARSNVWIVPAGLAAGLLLYGLYNWGTTGNPFVPGYIKLYGPSHGIGFGKGSWGPPHTLGLGLAHAGRTLVRLNEHLLQWPATSLWPIAAALVPPIGWLVRETLLSWKRALLLAAFPAIVLVAYIFYWYYDSCFGPRYLYDALGPLIVLSGWGIVRLVRAAEATRLRKPLAAVALGLVVAGCVGYAAAVRIPALVTLTPEAASAPPGSPARVGSYFLQYTPRYWAVGPYLGQLVEREGVRNAIVFVRPRERQPDALQVRHIWFGSAFALEEPYLERASVIYAHDRGAENARLLALYPGRTGYLYDGTIEDGRLIPLAP